MTQPTRHNLMLPEERMLALRELSEALGGATMSETLQKLFDSARQTGLMKGHNLPNVQVNAVSDGIVVQFDEHPHVSFTFDSARTLAAAIRRFTAGTNATPVETGADGKFSVRRKGRGVIVAIGPSEKIAQKAWNEDIADEFADLLDAAAKKIEP